MARPYTARRPALLFLLGLETRSAISSAMTLGSSQGRPPVRSLARITTPFGSYRWDPELRPRKVPRAVLPAHVHAYVADTSIKGNGKGTRANWTWNIPSREMAQPDKIRPG